MSNGSALVLSIFIIGLIVCIMWCFNKYIKAYDDHKNKEERNKIYEINVNAMIGKDIPELLDLIVNESFTDYQIMKILPIKDEYINSEEEERMYRELGAMVTERMGEASLDKLSLFYKHENIANILADKVTICVMNYVIEHNVRVTNLGVSKPKK